ncbi:hypothetical protein ACFLXO_03500, partial [Chloroflexota bacterium]
AFNLRGLQATTHPSAPLVVVNGPIAKKLNINAKSGAFGPGWRSNATIGRAIRLILMNIGGAWPGITDMSTIGQPCKYTFCIAENEEENPWEPLHVERGFDASTSTVTVVAWAENPYDVNDPTSVTAEESLDTIASAMVHMGNNTLLYYWNGGPTIAICPEHADMIAKGGFSKSDVKAFLYEKARIPRKEFSKSCIKRNFADLDEDALIPVATDKDRITIIVVGGPGKHSAVVPSRFPHITKAIL